jgi:cyclopropane fatty-acyl-phospholipid synthase-like methyltransferase
VTRAGKPFSPACERNRDPILQVLHAYFRDRTHVLEIGSGTGQHAVHFAGTLPHLTWQATDRAENLAGIRAWLDETGLRNTPAPLEFDVAVHAAPVAPGSEDSSSPATGPARPTPRYDAIFSANTLHIMSRAEVAELFARLSALATADAKLVIYGPFNYDGKYTSASNAAFDESLKAVAQHMGIRDVAEVDALARGAGFELVDDIAMPANNRCRLWQRSH